MLGVGPAPKTHRLRTMAHRVVAVRRYRTRENVPTVLRVSALRAPAQRPIERTPTRQSGEEQFDL